MSIRATAAAQALSRTANLPSPSTYSVCGWGRMLVDRNDFQTWWTIENTEFEGFGADNDGTSLQFFSNTNVINIDTLVANRWFWWGITRNGTAVRVLYIPQPGAAVQTFTATYANTGTPTSMTALNDHGLASFVNGDGMAYKLWDAVLTDAELIQEAYTIRVQRTANLNLWTPMVASTVANAALDLSGNGRNWTVVSTPSIDDNAPISWGGRSIVYPITAAVTITAAGTSQAAEQAFAPVSPTAAVVGASQAAEQARAAVNATAAITAASQAAEQAAAAVSATAAVSGASQAAEQASAPVNATAAVAGASQAAEQAFAVTDASVTLTAAGSSQAASQASAAVNATAAVDGASQAPGQATGSTAETPVVVEVSTGRGPDEPYDDRPEQPSIEEILRQEDEDIIELVAALVTSGVLEWV